MLYFCAGLWYQFPGAGFRRRFPVRMSFMGITYLGMLSGRQDFVTLLTFETHGVPVFAQRRLLLGYTFAVTPHTN